jgi:hypothetical protein
MVKRAVTINAINSKMFELKCRLSKEKQTLIGRCKNAQLLFDDLVHAKLEGSIQMELNLCQSLPWTKEHPRDQASTQ